MIDETQKPRHSNISISDVKMNLTIPNVKLLLPYNERVRSSEIDKKWADFEKTYGLS